MQLEAINAELHDVARSMVAPGVAPVEKERLIARFHELHSTQKTLVRSAARQSIYFVHAPSAGMVKIGWSSNLNRRIQGLRMSSPVSLVLIGTITGGPSVEAALHKRWAALRGHGEWFRDTDDLMAELHRLTSDTPVFDRSAA